MGDAEGKDRGDPPTTLRYVEAKLLQEQGPLLKANVLKIAHHGSEPSSTLPFIEAVDPDIVVVESGRKNFNGPFLPDKTTLQRYCTHKPSTRIYQTDQNDEQEGLSENILVRSNGHDPMKAGRLSTVNPSQLRVARHEEPTSAAQFPDNAPYRENQMNWPPQ